MLSPCALSSPPSAGMSQAVFHRRKQARWQSPWALPSQTVPSRRTTFLIRRMPPLLPSWISLSTRRRTMNVRPQYLSISGRNGRPPSAPDWPSVEEISGKLRTVTRSPGRNFFVFRLIENLREPFSLIYSCFGPDFPVPVHFRGQSTGYQGTMLFFSPAQCILSAYTRMLPSNSHIDVAGVFSRPRRQS